jgi:methanogenic corrinoid protein MtbC1
VAGEWHELGLRIIVGLMRERGWRVHFLGADVDPHFLQERVQRWRPEVVLLSAMAPERLPDVADAIAAVRTSRPGSGIPVVAGGQLVSTQADAPRALGAVPAVNGGLEAVLQALPVEQTPDPGSLSAG